MFRARKKIATVIDVGSSKLYALSGALVGANISVINECMINYSGFQEAEFFEEDEVLAKIKEAYFSVVQPLEKVPKTVGVSVPAEFCFSTTKKVNATFSKQEKITQSVLDEIFESAKENYEGYALIQTLVVEAVLGDGQKTTNPLGQKTTKISVLVNAIYAQKKFINLFNRALKDCGVEKVNYINSALSVVQGTLGEPMRTVCIVDSGYLTSSIVFARGAGLESVFTFSKGSADIEVEFMDEFGVSYPEAQALKKNIVLSIEGRSGEFYEVLSVSSPRKVLADAANRVVFEFLDELAYVISDCVEKVSSNVSEIYLTGGGVATILGAKEFLAESLGCEVKVLKSDFLGYNKPHQTSAISLFLSQINQ